MLFRSGETGSGGKILQLFQESPLLKDPVFKATMVRMTNPNSERFHISGELVAAELPKQLLLSDASAVMTVPGVPVIPVSPAGAPASAKAAVTPMPVLPVAAPPPVVAPGAVPAPGGSPLPLLPTDAARKGSPSLGSAPTPEKRP